MDRDRRKRVIVVDDHRETRETLCDLLAHMGHDARAAATGMEAIELALDQRPDVVLLDLGLPDMPGHDVALQLRSLLQHGLLLVAVTGRTLDGDARRSYAAGMDVYLRKPVRMETLRDVIAGAGAPAAGR